MTVKPLVSIIIAAYNAESFIAQAIESVLAQDYKPLEVIVVDDGSSDRTALITETFGEQVSCIRAEHKGPAAARNVGFKALRGDFWSLLDADDLYLPGKIALQLELLRQNPAAGMAMGIVENWQLASAAGDPMVFQPLRRGTPLDIILGRGLYRRSVLDQVGLFDESLLQYEDWDWLARAYELQISKVQHNDIVMHVRRHTSNVTLDVKTAAHFRMVAMKRALDRRRARESAGVQPKDYA